MRELFNFVHVYLPTILRQYKDCIDVKSDHNIGLSTEAHTGIYHEYTVRRPSLCP